ncbi:ribokinase [Paenibacillus xanthanilyticus]|uniref:Ribokinase n=1 Tax=Paenibacillus xanthanilyticus TaxID=1783531 RepID=A0ABV8K9K4_9BACL
MKPRIAVVGSMNMDIVVTMLRMPQVGETVQGSAIHYVPGGKGANQSAAAARLGADVRMIGAVGTDPFGQKLTANLQAFNIDHKGIEALDDVQTGTAVILHAQEDNCIVVTPGANSRCTPDLVRRHRAIIEQADLLLVQLEIPLESVLEALRIARGAGVMTILNPAPAVSLPFELLSLVDILTPNETEFALLSNEPVARTDEMLKKQLAAWRSRFEGKVIVTRGRKGSSYLDDAGEMRTAAALEVAVADTTGAGDAFNGALGYGLASGCALGDAVDFGARAASRSVMGFGAQGALPTLAEVEATYGS